MVVEEKGTLVEVYVQGIEGKGGKEKGEEGEEVLLNDYG